METAGICLYFYADDVVLIEPGPSEHIGVVWGWVLGG